MCGAFLAVIFRGVSVSIDKLRSWNDYRRTISRREWRRPALPNAVAGLPSNILGCEKILYASAGNKIYSRNSQEHLLWFLYFADLSPNGRSLADVCYLSWRMKTRLTWFREIAGSCWLKGQRSGRWKPSPLRQVRPKCPPSPTSPIALWKPYKTPSYFFVARCDHIWLKGRGWRSRSWANHTGQSFKVIHVNK